MKNTKVINIGSVASNSGSSSKGNQPKWYDDGFWYKADHMGYEGLSEAVVSELIKKTNVSNFIDYDPIIIIRSDKENVGCRCKNFKKPNETIITLERLFRAYNGQSLATELLNYSEVKDKIKFTVDFVERHTGIKNFGEYLTAMLELDAFFLNEDRHTNNIAFIRDDDTDKFSLCPYFDFGLSLLSDTNDYPLDCDVYESMSRVKGKPFDNDFDLQVDAAEELYSIQLKIKFNDADIIKTVEKYKDYYGKEAINRVTDILLARKRKFNYLTI